MELFNTVQWFDDNTFEYVRRNVPVEEAMKAAHHYCTSIAAQAGVTKQVIVTDQDDMTVFQWKFGEGVVYPTPEMLEEARKKR